MSRRRLATPIALAIGITAILSARLSHPELSIDEITYASTVVESMRQGSVFPVRGTGELFFNKPPLSFWLMRLSCEILGPSPFAVRLPSVLAAAATAVLIYLCGAALYGEGAGILAALIFAFTPGLLVLHGIRSATLDALEILLVTSAIVCLEIWRRRRLPWALTCLVICAAASAWVKSPFSLVVLMAYLLATELPARRAGVGTPRFGATVALVAGAWIGAYLLWLGTLSAASSPRAVIRQLLLGQYGRRLAGRLIMPHVHGPGFYLTSLLRDFGPLLLLPAGALAVSRLASKRDKQPRPYDGICLAVWSLAAPVLATASLSKVPWYAYLSYPGIALLLGWSAGSLAQAVAGRRAVQAAFWAVCVSLLVWRIPAGDVWPAEERRRGAAGRLWTLASRNPQIALVAAPGFQLTRQPGEREARLLLRMLLWRQSRSISGLGPCRAILVNYTRLPARDDVVVLSRPTRRHPGILIIDHCGGWLHYELTR